jgi:hypothetical protein
MGTTVNVIAHNFQNRQPVYNFNANRLVILEMEHAHGYTTSPYAVNA